MAAARILGLALALLGAAGCSSHQLVAEHSRWSLYALEPSKVDAHAFERAYEPAFGAVEEQFGPFERRVRVHVWADTDRSGDGQSGVAEPREGQARVRAFHARGGTFFGPPAGIHDSAADAGTAVHELVHARLAESSATLPLWFEEGLADVLGDGFLDGPRWVRDGYACWPVRELRDKPLTLAETEHLLALKAGGASDLPESVRVHFLGWAVVFDLLREAGSYAWRDWSRRASGMSAAEALERAQRSLSRTTEEAWLARLDSPEREVRLATAKGLWKLRSDLVLPALLDRLDVEEDVEVRVGLALNALAAAGELPPSGARARRMWRTVWPTLRRAELADPAENAALSALLRTFRWRGGGRSDTPLEALRRFWAE